MEGGSTFANHLDVTQTKALSMISSKRNKPAASIDFFPHRKPCILNLGICLRQPLSTRRVGGYADRPKWLAVSVLLCLTLLLLLTCVQAVHMHAAQTSQDHCPICMVLHSAVPIAVTATVLILAQRAELAPVLKARAVSRRWHLQLFTRPPPACN